MWASLSFYCLAKWSISNQTAAVLDTYLVNFKKQFWEKKAKNEDFLLLEVSVNWNGKLHVDKAECKRLYVSLPTLICKLYENNLSEFLPVCFILYTCQSMNCIGKNERCLRGRTEIDILFEDSSIFFVNVPFIKDCKYSSIFKKKSKI